MALTVKDVMELPCGHKMALLAGAKGLDRPVVTVEIADYEFDPDVDYDAALEMEASGFIITSFLFAKNDPSLILKSIKQMYDIGMSCVAYKRIVYDELPPEAIAFAEEKGFPILTMDNDLWFENIIFDIMYAVQFDDKVYLSEENIDAMLSGSMNRSELDIILKGVSLKLRPYVAAVYITGETLDAGRILRSFYLLKGFHSKGLVVRYGDGVFLITTSARDDHRSHDLIRQEAFELLGIGEDVHMGMSDVHEKTDMDKAFRESWQCLVASLVEGKQFACFGDTGICRVLLPTIGSEESRAFAKDMLEPFRDNADLLETAGEYIAAGGDILKTAAKLHCHQNTIRYRLGRIRELTGLEDVTDGELYLQLKAALLIDGAMAISGPKDQNPGQ